MLIKMLPPKAVSINYTLDNMEHFGFTSGINRHLKPGVKMSTKVEMITSKGTMTIELDEEAAPVTAKNFLSYADKEFFDGLRNQLLCADRPADNH